jgi:hypothetical protein
MKQSLEASSLPMERAEAITGFATQMKRKIRRSSSGFFLAD